MNYAVICSSDTCKHYDCETRWVGSNALTHSVVCIDFSSRCADYTEKDTRTKPVFYCDKNIDDGN